MTEPDTIAAVRRRPGMYLGGTDDRGLLQVVLELVANGLDEFLAGRAGRIDVRVDDGVIRVRDDGDGMPFDVPGPTGTSLAEHHLVAYHDTPSAGHVPHVHLGTSGCGIFAVNAVAARLVVRSWRRGRLYVATYAEGRPVEPVLVESDPDGRGTDVEVRPDPAIFGAAVVPRSTLRRVLFDAAHLFGGLHVGFQDEVFHAPDGLVALLDVVLDDAREPGWPGRGEPRFACRVEVGGFVVEVAAVAAGRREPRVLSWCNGVRTAENGSHVDGVEAAFLSAGWRPTTWLVHAVGREPRFAGPTRGTLDVPELRVPLRDALEAPLAAWLAAKRR